MKILRKHFIALIISLSFTIISSHFGMDPFLKGWLGCMLYFITIDIFNDNK